MELEPPDIVRTLEVASVISPIVFQLPFPLRIVVAVGDPVIPNAKYITFVVSIETLPDVVIVVKSIPVPAETLVTVPVEPLPVLEEEKPPYTELNIYFYFFIPLLTLMSLWLYNHYY